MANYFFKKQKRSCASAYSTLSSSKQKTHCVINSYLLIPGYAVTSHIDRELPRATGSYPAKETNRERHPGREISLEPLALIMRLHCVSRFFPLFPSDVLWQKPLMYGRVFQSIIIYRYRNTDRVHRFIFFQKQSQCVHIFY